MPITRQTLQLGFFVDGGFYLIYLAPSFPNLGLAFIGLVRVFSPTVLSIVPRLETSIFNKLVINKLEKKKKKKDKQSWVFVSSFFLGGCD